MRINWPKAEKDTMYLNTVIDWMYANIQDVDIEDLFEMDDLLDRIALQNERKKKKIQALISDKQKN